LKPPKSSRLLWSRSSPKCWSNNRSKQLQLLETQQEAQQAAQQAAEQSLLAKDVATQEIEVQRLKEQIFSQALVDETNQADRKTGGEKSAAPMQVGQRPE
jgi:hypothetical protein